MVDGILLIEFTTRLCVLDSVHSTLNGFVTSVRGLTFKFGFLYPCFKVHCFLVYDFMLVIIIVRFTPIKKRHRYSLHKALIDGVQFTIENSGLLSFKNSTKHITNRNLSTMML